MSEARLRQKLVQAGYHEVHICTFDRATLLEYYAKVLLAEMAYVPAKEEQDEDEDGGGDSEEEAEFAEGMAKVQHAGGNLSVEERRLALEERKVMLKEQRMQREQQQEQQRVQLEQQRMQLEEKRLEDQKLQREEQRLQREQQWEEQRRQREFEERKWREERAYKDSTAVKIKTWDDALRNTITKMPSEGIGVVSWFVSIDKLFEQLSVPTDLQAILIRPYLSDRAKLLISKCDPTHSAKYKNIKSFLLKELHLSPAVYLEKFNSLIQDKSETYTQFSTRLMSLFEYYLSGVKKNRSKL